MSWDEKANGRVLALLRVLVQVPQKWLKARLGLSGKDDLTRFERGTTVLPFETLEEGARLLGQPAVVVNEAFGLVELWHQAGSLPAGSEGTAGPHSEAAEVEDLVAEFQVGLGGAFRQVINRIKLVLFPRWERELAPQLWRLIAPWTPEQRLAAVRVEPLFQRWALAELLCELSVRAAGDQAGKALGLAELACEVAAKVPGMPGWRQRVQGFCQFHRANSWRVHGELSSAREVTEKAAKLWKAGEKSDPGLLDEARVLGLQASLLRDQRELAKALRLYDEALKLPETREQPFLLLAKAKALEEKGDYSMALELILDARRKLPAVEARRHLVTLSIEAWLYCHLERFAEAKALLPEVRRRVRQLGNDLDRVRCTWLEGRVARGFDRIDLALSHLETARRAFAEQKIRYDQALVTLEIAEVLAAAGRAAEVRPLARSLVPAFQDQGVHPEAARALRLFTKAAEQEALTAGLARQMVRYLFRARYNPELRFQAV